VNVVTNRRLLTAMTFSFASMSPIEQCCTAYVILVVKVIITRSFSGTK